MIGMYIRVLPLLIRMSPGRFPSPDRAPVQARSPPTSRSSPAATSHGPHCLVTGHRPPGMIAAVRLSSRVVAVGPDPRGTNAGDLPCAAGAHSTRRVVDRPIAGLRQCVESSLDGQRDADRRVLGDVVARHLGPRGAT